MCEHYTIYNPIKETFGENVGTLTREVFCHEIKRSGYYKMILDMVNQSNTFEAALEKFNGKLGDEGKSIMLFEFYNKKGDKNA